MTALKSGIDSKSLVIPGEDPEQVTTLTEEYFQRFHPALPEQRDLVDILVRSTPPAARKATPNTPKRPLPFHHAGSPCYFDPIDRKKYKRCPTCFPDDCYPDAQE